MDKIIISEDRYGRKLNHFEEDDFIDRLNSRYTVMLLVMCIFIITGKSYVGDAINCWTPAQFSGTHNSYTNSICWLKGSYYLPTEEITIPDRSKPRHYHVSYYQWTPFILLGMALLFLVPRFLWHSFTRQGGLNIRRLVSTIKDKPDNEAGVTFAKKVFKSYLDSQSTLGGTICCGKRIRGFYLSYTIVYFIIKILYVMNTLTQFFLLNAFLSFNFSAYGAVAINKLFTGDTDWFESPRFPRVTMCDFMIRHLGSNQHWYAIQCNLPINIYNEKIFIGIWIWLIILTILNVISIVRWIISLTRRQRFATIKKHLKVSQSSVPSEKETLLSSTATSGRSEAPLLRSPRYNELTDYMHIDGFLIFDLIAHNTDDIVAGKILEHLHQNCPQPRRDYTHDV